MRALVLLVLWLVPLSVARLAAAQAGERVDVALVLVSDVSRSITDGEYDTQKRGYVAAFNDPRVLLAIQSGAAGRIAVAYVEFAGPLEVQTVLDWHMVADADSAHALGEAITAAPRSFWGRTSISAGIDRAMRLLAEGGFETSNRVIDIAGDGTNNAGRDVRAARDEAVEAGVTINGLAIINDHPVSWTSAHVQPPGGLAAWYRDNLMGGPNGFVIEVHEFSAFGEAMSRKLVSEIAEVIRSKT